MKPSVLLTSILFVAVVGCELRGADEPTSPPAGTNPSLHEQGKGTSTEPKPWDRIIALGTAALAIGTIILTVFTAKAARVAKSTESVFQAIVKTLEHTRARSEEAAVVQTMSMCMDQYQDLENKVRASSKDAIEAKRYFELLWNLHFAEFQFFKRRFLPEDVYGLWVWVRRKDYREDRTMSSLGMSEVDGWNHAKIYLQDDDFASFVDSWLDKRDLQKADVMKIVVGQLPSVRGMTGKA